MLIDPSKREEPDLGLGSYLLSLVHDPIWVNRRIVSVTIADMTSQIVRTSVDIAPALVQQRFKSEQTRSVLPEVLPLPIAAMRKDLLIDFDVRGPGGEPLSIASREDDAYAAWSMLLALASRVLPDTGITERVADALHAAVFDFPDADNHLSEPPSTRPVPDSLRTRAERSTWHELVTNPYVAALLFDLSTQFLLIAKVKVEEPPRIVKFAHREGFEFPNPRLAQRVGLTPRTFRLDVPGITEHGSHHFRVEAPEGLMLTGVKLLREEADDDRLPATHYRKRLGGSGAHLYTRSAPASNRYRISIRVRPSVRGFVRMAPWSAALTAAMLLTGAFFADRIEGGGPDTAGALLLAAPSLLSAYVVRLDEHEMAGELLRWPRIIVTIPGLSALAAAFVLFFKFTRGDTLQWVWAVLGGVSLVCSVVLFAVLWAASRDIRDVGSGTETDIVTPIVVR